MFPAGASPGPARAPPLSTPGLAWPPPHRTLCPHVPGLCSPTSLHCPAQPRYGSARIPPPARSHDLLLLSAPASGRTLPRPEPQEVQQGEAQSPAPGEGQHQAPAPVVGCLAGKQPGKGDHAAVLTHRLSSRSSRSSLGAGIFSPLLGKDPSLAESRQMDAKRLRTLG
ncbi:hypothetical protein QYF61_010837 [Mycteria americana]|uniref:Uncharacterized protein n=1 Tax=Mycteria americana TaxID=33587 RepID=A0AAN7MYF3_MYCAM|nr:hypothetical protein QYF61_010837 [Mycteria americana]